MFKKLILLFCLSPLVALVAAQDSSPVWQAKWIEPGYAEDTLMRPIPYFTKSFTTGKKLISAKMYITAHGLYEASINGKRIGDAYFTPGWTSYNKRLQYQEYDVTALLQKGKNDISVALGSGWYSGTIGIGSGNTINNYGKTVGLLCQLELTYNDGSKIIIVSDSTWRSATGPIRYSELYNGETIDGRKTNETSYPVKVASHPMDNLVATIGELVRQHETFQPIKIFKAPNGDTLADFGQNLAGWVKITVRGKSGDIAKLDYAEVLDKAGNFYTTNLRLAKQEDTYILNGRGDETFEPHFTYHGFRYVRLHGLMPLQMEAVALYTDMKKTGSFECSNPLLNQLQHNIVWSQNSNFVDIPTDCPQRDERMGWMGDAMVFCRTAAFNRDVYSFFFKWLKDVAADQFSNGALPQIVPNILGQWGGSAGWSDAATVIPWTMYQVYGKKEILEQQYASMKAWVSYMEKNSPNNLWSNGFQFGDWLSFRSEGLVDRSALTDTHLVQQAFYAYSTQIMLNTAKVLDKQEDIFYYTALLEHIKAAFLKEYVTPSGNLLSNTQTAYTLALAFDVLPENLRPVAAKKLAENIAGYNYHLTTGFLGTPYLCPVLARFGYTAIAYKLLLQEDYPSWLYQVKQGATTIWERWDGIKPDGSFQDPAMNSFNHYAYGAIGNFLYETVAGIQPASPGYQKIRIAPQPGGGLTFVNASLETAYGKINVNWKIETGLFKLDVSVPANTTAEIVLPGNAQPFPVTPGTYHFEKKLTS